MSGIKMSALVKEYPGGVRAVNEVDLEVYDGEFFTLLGPSGCGKTTLLRSIAGLEGITSGKLEIGAVEHTHTEPGERGVAMVFQDYALFPHMDVADNIAYPLRIQKVGKAERRERAREVGESLSLQGLLERRPGQLSGGQQQRVALSRAVATRPQVLLLDEPLSNLDARLRLEARTFLKELQRDLGLTTVFVTHDQAEALALSDRIAVMKLGELQQVGTPIEVFQKPANTFVAGFIGSHPMNLVETQVSGGTLKVGDSHVALPYTPAEQIDGKPVTWGIRPEYLEWSTTERENSIKVTVDVVENLGASFLILVSAGAERLQAVVSEDDVPAVGATGWVTPKAGKGLLFNTETTQRIDEQ